ncbi:MAG: serine/threonine-protein kinase [Archangium sp.]|nr:serine/threonine-protein kinase [Archangium sp.]MDP3156445.1 serine/threonine-protein kinase [Archangium sp.]MDP3573109.1 serine/threonine-protein kinase [Archangium sp.]
MSSFQVLGKLGAGGMADVFLARHSVPGSAPRLVALKRIRASMEERPEVWVQFQREAAISKLLVHPCIVRLEGVGSDAEGPWLALEYIAGTDANRLISACTRTEKPFPLRWALMLCRDAAEGIAWAHALEHDGGVGVVHRDISTDNLLVGYDGRSRVADFGIAHLDGHTRMTRTGEVRGKIAYLAPEIINGASPSMASDVFAFAATVYKTLTGVAAFRGTNDGEIFRALMTTDPAPISGLRPDVPRPVAQWLDRAFSKEPERRPTAASFVELMAPATERERAAFGAWVLELRPPRTPPPEPGMFPGATTVIRAPRSRLPRWGALGLLLAAIAFGVASLRRDPEPVPAVAVEGPKPAALPPVAAPEPAVQTPPGEPPVVPVEKPPVAPKPVRQKVGRSSLDLRVTPYADVFVDGRLLGTTPLKPIELTPGVHQVLLVNEALDVRRATQVTLEPGKRQRLEVDLRKP